MDTILPVARATVFELLAHLRITLLAELCRQRSMLSEHSLERINFQAKLVTERWLGAHGPTTQATAKRPGQHARTLRTPQTARSPCASSHGNIRQQTYRQTCPGKHFLGEVAFGYGLLITPTCDIAEQHGTSLAAHPYRVSVPVLPLDLVIEQTAAIEKSLRLLRSRDTITPYMYLPPYRGDAAP